MPLIASAALHSCTNILAFIDSGPHPRPFVVFATRVCATCCCDALTRAAVPSQQKMIEAKLKLMHRLQFQQRCTRAAFLLLPQSHPVSSISHHTASPISPHPVSSAHSEAAAKCLRVTSDENELECSRRATLLCSLEYGRCPFLLHFPSIPAASYSSLVRASAFGSRPNAVPSCLRTQGPFYPPPSFILSLACFPTSCPGQTCAQSPGCAVRLRHTEEPGAQFQAQRHQERGDRVLAAALCCAVGCVPSHSSAGSH